MPGGSTPELGNTAFSQVILANITPAASVTAATSTTSTYTINGIQQGDLIVLAPQAAIQALLDIGSVWVSAANTLSIQWINQSASNSSASPASVYCVLYIVRPTFISYPLTTANQNWPTALE